MGFDPSGLGVSLGFDPFVFGPRLWRVSLGSLDCWFGSSPPLFEEGRRGLPLLNKPSFVDHHTAGLQTTIWKDTDHPSIGLVDTEIWFLHSLA